MGAQRVLAIGLDGYEQTLGQRLMDAGELPHLAALRDRSARFLLDHGSAKRTGLAWEQVSTGKSPQDANRWSAVDFNTDTYEIWQTGTSLPPFPAALQARTVVFDPPYFDMSKALDVRGIVNWGAHDPGVQTGSHPEGLLEELIAKFGRYPSSGTMYDIAWPSVERTQLMGEALVRSAEVRTQAALWLFKERCPDWDLALVVAGELHSAIENLWHGIDPTHPLHQLPSAKVAGELLKQVHRSTDVLVGELTAAFPDATIVAFNMNGMGPNQSDVASMVLLSELAYRKNFGIPLMRVPRAWRNAPNGVPLMEPEMGWARDIKTWIKQMPEPWDRLRRLAVHTLPEFIRARIRKIPPPPTPPAGGPLRIPLTWMPTSLYQPYWPEMRFFALPAFYDGRIRINLAGRERNGIVPLSEYEAVCDEVEALVRACRDPRTGEPIVDHVDRSTAPDPFKLDPSDSDLIIVWSRATQAFEHPELGLMGPLPYCRPGGHTGPYGMAYIAGPDIDPGDCGVRSSFDVIPTIVRLLDEEIPDGMSGHDLLTPQLTT